MIEAFVGFNVLLSSVSDMGGGAVAERFKAMLWREKKKLKKQVCPRSGQALFQTSVVPVSYHI